MENLKAVRRCLNQYFYIDKARIKNVKIEQRQEQYQPRPLQATTITARCGQAVTAKADMGRTK